MKYTAILMTIFVSSASFAAETSSSQTLTNGEVETLLKKAGSSVFMQCFNYFEFDFFGQELVQSNYEEKDPVLAERKAKQFRNYITEGRLKIRTELLEQMQKSNTPIKAKIPVNIVNQCNRFASVAYEVAAVRAKITIDMMKLALPKMAEDIAKAITETLTPSVPPKK